MGSLTRFKIDCVVEKANFQFPLLGSSNTNNLQTNSAQYSFNSLCWVHISIEGGFVCSNSPFNSLCWVHVNRLYFPNCHGVQLSIPFVGFFPWAWLYSHAYICLSIPFVGFIVRTENGKRLTAVFSFQFPLLGSWPSIGFHHKCEWSLSIPFVGFAIQSNSILQEYKCSSFNSLCWVLKATIPQNPIVSIFFQFPLLGSTFSISDSHTSPLSLSIPFVGFIRSAYTPQIQQPQIFQFPLLGSEEFLELAPTAEEINFQFPLLGSYFGQLTGWFRGFFLSIPFVGFRLSRRISFLRFHHLSIPFVGFVVNLRRW